MRKRRGVAAVVSALALTSVVAACSPDQSAPAVTVAVATNFLEPIEEIERAFEAGTGTELTVVSGSTGQLYGQIVNGAPFDVLLAADSERPALLAERGLGDPATLFTYAIGRTVLWSAEPGRVDDTTLSQLADLEFRRLAIANPTLAPYGVAARDVLSGLGLWDALQPRIVQGQNIGQTFALVQSGNAELGFVALSQALVYSGQASYSIVPADMHAPVRQDALVLTHGAENPAAAAFVEFLRSGTATRIIEQFGYTVP